jgi:hypothetical protein
MTNGGCMTGDAALRTVVGEWLMSPSPRRPGVPEGSYASDPDDVSRIRELRGAVQALHSAGLLVVLDVVWSAGVLGAHRLLFPVNSKAQRICTDVTLGHNEFETRLRLLS